MSTKRVECSGVKSRATMKSLFLQKKTPNEIRKPMILYKHWVTSAQHVHYKEAVFQLSAWRFWDRSAVISGGTSTELTVNRFYDLTLASGWISQYYEHIPSGISTNIYNKVVHVGVEGLLGSCGQRDLFRIIVTNGEVTIKTIAKSILIK